MGFTPDVPADEAWTFDKVTSGRRSNAKEISVERIRDAAIAISPYIKQTPTLLEYHLSERFATPHK